MSGTTLIPKDEIVKFINILIEEFHLELINLTTLTQPNGMAESWAGGLTISRKKIASDEVVPYGSPTVYYEYVLGIKSDKLEKSFIYIDASTCHWIVLTPDTLTVTPSNSRSVSIKSNDLYKHYAPKLNKAIEAYTQAQFASAFRTVVQSTSYSRKLSIDTFLEDNKDE